MKSLIAAATMILSASAFAGAPAHDYHQVLGEIKLKNACVTESEVRTINPQTVCTELTPVVVGDNAEGGIYTDWRCTSWETKDLSASRAFERKVCLRHAPINEASHGECLEYGTKSDFLPDTIKIYKVYTNGEVSREVRGTHTFPACN